jgi:hypothetical protein
MTFLALSEKNENELIALRRHAQQLVINHNMDALQCNYEDITSLQLVYDLGLVKQLSDPDMMSLGVIFGDVFRHAIPDLHWAVSNEVTGQTTLQQYCLQFKDSPLAVYPIETYVVPYELGDVIDVRQAFDEKVSMMRMFIGQNMNFTLSA